MATRLEVAKRLYGGRGAQSASASSAGGSSGATAVRYGTAAADSEGGRVDVTLDVSGETVSCSCDSPIYEGQRVTVLVTSAGRLKAMPIGDNIVDMVDATEQGMMEFENAITEELERLKADVSDGRVDTWFTDVDPTPGNYPASGWEDASDHAGDVCYNTATGKLWYWVWQDGSGSWAPLEDAEIKAAMQAAQDALTVADGKKTVFYGTSTPSPPYAVGDLWCSGSDQSGENGGDLMVCTASRDEGEAAQEDDWAPATRWSETISSVEEELITFGDSLEGFSKAMGDLESQVDGKVETWFYAYAPTASNLPASGWSSDERASHAGDLFYDTSNGYCYRWTGSAWSQVTDSRITKAMDAASDAQDTADSKRRVFYPGPPSGPYDPGDLWIQGSTGDIRVCTTARTSSGYLSGHWVLASKYTDDTAVEEVVDTFSMTRVAATVTRTLDGSTSTVPTVDPCYWWVFKPTDAQYSPTIGYCSIPLSDVTTNRQMGGGPHYISDYTFTVRFPSQLGSFTEQNLPICFVSASGFMEWCSAFVYNRSTTQLGPIAVYRPYNGASIESVRLEIMVVTRRT